MQIKHGLLDNAQKVKQDPPCSQEDTPRVALIKYRSACTMKVHQHMHPWKISTYLRSVYSVQSKFAPTEQNLLTRWVYLYDTYLTLHFLQFYIHIYISINKWNVLHAIRSLHPGKYTKASALNHLCKGISENCLPINQFSSFWIHLWNLCSYLRLKYTCWLTRTNEADMY